MSGVATSFDDLFEEMVMLRFHLFGRIQAIEDGDESDHEPTAEACQVLHDALGDFISQAGMADLL